jgi:hypothetical protein
VRLLHNAVWIHTSAQTVAWLQKQKQEVLHPPHSPDLVPIDFYLFRTSKNFYIRYKIWWPKHIAENSYAIFHIHWKGTVQWVNTWSCKIMG